MTAMNRRMRELQDSITRELDNWQDAKLVSLEHRNHIRVTLQLGDRRGAVYTATSPGDKRGDKNMIAHIRRKLRELQEAA